MLESFMVVQVNGPEHGVVGSNKPLTPPELKHRIAYFDNRPLTRECVRRWLAESFPEVDVEVHGTGEDISRFDPDEKSYQLYLYYLGADRVSSPQIAQDLTQLAETGWSVPLALFAEGEEPGRVMEALGLGIKGYIPTSLDWSIAVQVLRLVCAGGTYAPASALHGPASRPEVNAIRGTHRFTPRQMEIVGCLRRGMPNKLIAHELGMSEATVKVHVRNIMKKLKATNRTQVVLQTWDAPAEAAPSSFRRSICSTDRQAGGCAPGSTA